MMKCKICGHKFTLKAEKRYEAYENKGFDGVMNGTRCYECFDCPECGCQNAVNVRRPKLFK